MEEMVLYIPLKQGIFCFYIPNYDHPSPIRISCFPSPGFPDQSDQQLSFGSQGIVENSLNSVWNENQYLQERASLVAQTVKSLLAVLETQVQFLGQEDPLEKEIANHSSILAWRIPWMEEPGGLQTVGHNWGTNTTTSKRHLMAKRRLVLSAKCESFRWACLRLTYRAEDEVPPFVSWEAFWFFWKSGPWEALVFWNSMLPCDHSLPVYSSPLQDPFPPLSCFSGLRLTYHSTNNGEYGSGESSQFGDMKVGL